jgi:hypothetical protein
VGSAPPAARLVVSFGRDPGKVVISIETAPDWEIETSRAVSEEALREFWPILRQLTKIRNLTGESFDS